MLCSACKSFFAKVDCLVASNLKDPDDPSTKHRSPADWPFFRATLHDDIRILSETSFLGCELCALSLAGLSNQARSIGSTISGNVVLTSNPGGRSRTHRAHVCHLIVSADALNANNAHTGKFQSLKQYGVCLHV